MGRRKEEGVKKRKCAYIILKDLRHSSKVQSIKVNIGANSRKPFTVDEPREISSLLVGPAIDVLCFVDATLWE